MKRYVHIGLSHFLKFKTYSLINIAGFGIALSVCMAILLFTNYHFSFDKFIDNSENSYRIISRYGEGTSSANTFAGFNDVLSNCPEVVSYTVAYTVHHVHEMYIGDDKFECKEVIFANTSFLDYFSVQMLEGDRQSINQPNTALVTPAMAKKLFPNGKALNKMVFVKSFSANRDSLIPFTITGIVQPLPAASHLGFEILLSQKGHFGTTTKILKSRKAFGATIYIKLFDNINITDFEQSISKKVAITLQAAPGPPAEVFKHKLQAVTDIHFSTETMSELRPTIRRSILYILLLTGILVFAIATVNFVNIQIARASYHRKQSEIIEFLGGGKKHLFANIFTEVLLSVTGSFILAILLLLVFNQTLTNQFFINPNVLSNNNHFWPIATALYVIVGFFVSLLCSAIFIKNKSFAKQNTMAVWLVVFQFVLVIALIGFTILMNKQMRFIHQKAMGYASENVVIVEIYKRNAKIKTFRDEVKKLPGVISAATAQHYPGFRFQDMNLSSGDNAFPFKFGFIDQFALNALDIQVIKYFHAAKEKATNGWYINEYFYNKLKEKYTEEQIATGSFPENNNQSSDENLMNFEILGVTRDFHYTSLHTNIESFAFFVPENDTRNFRFLLVRINQHASQTILAEIEEKMHEIYPGETFSYHFLDEQLNKQYRSENSLLKLINLFSVLTILIACLGLIGLLLFMIEKRTKEIGIRKVNGASVFEILILFNNYFVKLIVLAFVVATPIAWYAMNYWLQNFAYKTEMNWWIFVLAGIFTLAIVLLTVSWQTFNVARRNPVEALRYE